MSGGRAASGATLSAAQLTRLAELDTPAALVELESMGLHDVATVTLLAEAALQQAETTTNQAQRWLALAAVLNRTHGDDLNLRAQIQYAQARLHVYAADLAAAEAALREAQRNWQRGGDLLAYNRSFLGLTQILAMQGRYTEAEEAIRQALANLAVDAATDADVLQLAATAQRNFATLLTYQEKHAAALVEYEQARRVLEQLYASARQDEAVAVHVHSEMAHISLNQANALMFLDRPDEAEAMLHEAVDLFNRVDDTLNRGRARTNLGTLYLRTGRYAASLAEFDNAAVDLLDDDLLHELTADATQTDSAGRADPNATEESAVELEQLRPADLLLLERAHAYVALNLLPEALSALAQCETIFRRADQPYELGQSLYTLGLLYARTRDFAHAEAALTASERVFAGLENAFWRNRTRIALAVLAYQQEQVERAEAQISVVLTELERVRVDDSQAVTWDIQTLAEAHLLQVQLLLGRNQVEAARRVATTLAAELGIHDAGMLDTERNEADASPAVAENEHVAHGIPLPHLSLRLEHVLGRVAAASAQHGRARSHYRTAIDLLEAQRASLPFEEVRTAFLDDKTAVYEDLVLDLLHESTCAPALVREAFNTVERGRARALLERLSHSTATATSSAFTSSANPSVDTTRQRVHWLYNRLLGEEGPRQLDARQMQALYTQERALQWREQRASALLTQAQPVQVTALQQALLDDEQALVYYMADDEVMCFLIDAGCIQVKRHLCSVAELQRAQSELHFQLGRIELGAAYYERHAARLQRALNDALHHLYRLLVAPLASQLDTARLLIIPYGSLHLLPFHALWDGAAFLIERFECSYAPSASIAVHCRDRTARSGVADGGAMTSLAGLALSDPAIPAARREAQLAAAHFAQAWLYLDDEASYASLQTAAGQADILHLATHGLFRPDNPFFSALKLADGWIDVWQIYRLSLAARLVVLSACESGAGEVRGGDELVGLARGFLGAGAQSLLVSLWTVHDASAAQLMDRFYACLTEQQSARRPAESLRRAQLDAICEKRHPYFWAPFFVIG